jgi:hypothetical protein
MSAAETVMVCTLVAICTASLVGMLYMLATESLREHYRKANVAWESHVDQALEVTR